MATFPRRRLLKQASAAGLAWAAPPWLRSRLDARGEYSGTPGAVLAGHETGLETRDALQTAGIREIPLKQISIEDSFWSPRLEVNRTKTLDHVYQELESTGCIRNFEIAAKKSPGSFGGPWWADSDVYKWIEGVSYALGNKPDAGLERRLDEVISKIAAAQQPDGYLNTHVQVEEPDLRFRNLAFFHEDFSSGHLFEAGAAHYEATGKRTLLEVATRLADCFDRTFGPGRRDGLSGHEGIELAWVRLYRVTGDKRYLKLAEFYLNERGRKPSVFQREYESLPANRTVQWRQGRPMNLRALQQHFYLAHPPAFDTSYCQDHLSVREQSAAVGHAVRAMFLYCGMADVAYETGDQGLIAALNRLFESVTLRRMYVTGGIGPSARNEGFTDDYDLPNENAYQETCASAGMVLWNYRMFKLTGDACYIDLLEQSLYNAVLAGVSLEGNSFCYATPPLPAIPNSDASRGSKYPAARQPRRASSLRSGGIPTASPQTASGSTSTSAGVPPSRSGAARGSLCGRRRITPGMGAPVLNLRWPGRKGSTCTCVFPAGRRLPRWRSMAGRSLRRPGGDTRVFPGSGRPVTLWMFPSRSRSKCWKPTPTSCRRAA